MTNASFREELILSPCRRCFSRADCVGGARKSNLKPSSPPGTIGLIQSVDRFDPSRNLKLKTLAEHRALLDYLRHIDPSPRDVRRFPKQRDAMIDALSRIGEVPSHEGIAQVLGFSLRKYVMLSRMIAAAEPISIHESTVAAERAD